MCKEKYLEVLLSDMGIRLGSQNGPRKMVKDSTRLTEVRIFLTRGIFCWGGGQSLFQQSVMCGCVTKMGFNYEKP